MEEAETLSAGIPQDAERAGMPLHHGSEMMMRFVHTPKSANRKMRMANSTVVMEDDAFRIRNETERNTRTAVVVGLLEEEKPTSPPARAPTAAPPIVSFSSQSPFPRTRTSQIHRISTRAYANFMRMKKGDAEESIDWALLIWPDTDCEGEDDDDHKETAKTTPTTATNHHHHSEDESSSGSPNGTTPALTLGHLLCLRRNNDTTTLDSSSLCEQYAGCIHEELELTAHVHLQIMPHMVSASCGGASSSCGSLCNHDDTNEETTSQHHYHYDWQHFLTAKLPWLLTKQHMPGHTTNPQLHLTVVDHDIAKSLVLLSSILPEAEQQEEQQQEQQKAPTTEPAPGITTTATTTTIVETMTIAIAPQATATPTKETTTTAAASSKETTTTTTTNTPVMEAKAANNHPVFANNNTSSSKSNKKKKKKKRKHHAHYYAKALPPPPKTEASTKPLVVETPKAKQQDDYNDVASISSSQSTDSSSSSRSSVVLAPPPPPPPPPVLAVARPQQQTTENDDDDNDEAWEPVQIRRKKTPRNAHHKSALSRTSFHNNPQQHKRKIKEHDDGRNHHNNNNNITGNHHQYHQTPNSASTLNHDANKNGKANSTALQSGRQSNSSNTIVKESSKDQNTASKDQNTAATYQDTVTTVSKQQQQQFVPLLLSGDHASSATSSVASLSLLESPTSQPNNNDCCVVGYHLLDVCDRLSRDMSLFMSRRALALHTRRRERGALLNALQECISSLWEKKRVQLYGSCATDLDLPASDIDVVVMGLGNKEIMMGAVASPTPTKDHNNSSNYSSDASISLNSSIDEDESSGGTNIPSATTPSFRYNSAVMSNADRVRRLAAELENQPWAVQVRAIPTASVPVIKILADPSKLEGMHHHHLAAQAAAMAGNHDQTAAAAVSYGKMSSAVSDDSFQQSSLLPWRGSDVMNGLLSLDITFEGLEHGGLWSTEFSTMVVSQICAQSGLHPDATPFVQTLMVLKELLAQRKLNEPYSGGLSSYALLLLLLALVNERQIIREEIDRVEQQKRAMSAGADSPMFMPNYMGATPMSYAAAGMKPLGMYHPNGDDKSPPKTTTHKGEHANHDQPTQKSEPFNVPGKQSPQANATTPRSSPSAHPPSTHSAASSSLGQKSAAIEEHILRTTPKEASSWAAIAKRPQFSDKKAVVHQDNCKPEVQAVKPPASKQKSFADAVAGSLSAKLFAEEKEAVASTVKKSPNQKSPPVTFTDEDAKDKSIKGSIKSPPRGQKSEEDTSTLFATPERQLRQHHHTNNKAQSPVQPASTAGYTTVSTAETLVEGTIPTPCFPQGYNDIVEVLCSGETTAGKLLMHFLLYYGQHFDAQSTAIDVAAKHDREFNQQNPFSYYSPYIPRRSHGVIDPITGMLTVDPIVVYEPFEEAQNRNVARRCFAWNSVKWIFAQSYSTLASAVERSKTPPTIPAGGSGAFAAGEAAVLVSDDDDPSSSSLLRCLLSF